MLLIVRIREGLDREVAQMNVTPKEKAVRFRTLRDGPAPLILPNPWI